jgi:hypothetical protein
MIRHLLVALIWFSALPLLHGQLPPACAPGEQPADDCFSACIWCNFNNYSGSSAGYAAGNAPGFCAGIQNDQFLGFIASSPAATFTVTPTNCTDGNGLQIALYESCNTPPIACNEGAMGGGTTPMAISASMIVGTNYYLLIDGYGGDQCDFTLTVSPGINPPQVGPTGAISGPASVCPGATVTYSVANVANAGGYTWSAPPGATINGQPGPATFDAPDGRSVQITFGAQGGQICVTPANSCDNGTQACRSVTVAPLPPTTLPPVIVCNNELPYTLPWGQAVGQTGLYQTTLTSYLGCDSIVRQQVNVKPPIVVNAGLKTICEGSCYTACGEDFCDPGNYFKVCQSYQGCDSVVNFSVQVLNPEAQISGPTALTCASSSIVLTANTLPPGAYSRQWRNDANPAVVLGSGPTLTVNSPGTYTLTVTASAGGATCSSTASYTVTSNTTAPGVTTNSGVVGCGTGPITLTASSTTPGATFTWGTGATTPSITVSAPGSYPVTATNPSNGCTSTASAAVTGNTTPPTASIAAPATLTCTLTSTPLTATSNAANANFAWSGPGGAGGTTATINATAAGTYTVTVTDPLNGCTATATSAVSQNTTPPTVSAAASGPIACGGAAVTVTANTAATQFSWSGPLGFTANTASPAVPQAGQYTVTVTGANGCSATASVTVNGDTQMPTLNATGGAISCATPSLALSATTNATNPGFAWTGPNGFTANTANPSISAVGSYTVVVTNAANNCTASQTVSVTGDFAAPDATATGSTITCSSTTTQITGASSVAGVAYAWSLGGSPVSDQPIATVSNTGTYTLVVTAPNGCTATATAVVTPDANVPDASAAGGTLTCTTTSLVLTGGSTTPGVTTTWSDASGAPLGNTPPTVNAPGTYTLTVTSANGCSAEADAVVIEDLAAPGASTQDATLSCATASLNLTGSATLSTVTWAWSGPNGFSSTQQNPAVTAPGQYVLTVTNTANNCTSSATADIAADVNAPQAASNAGTLTCATTSLVLNGTSTLPASTFAWSGPNGFAATTGNATATDAGDYTLTVTAPNGCTGSITVTVDEDVAAPDLTATGATIDCSNPQVQVTATSTTPGIVYNWPALSSSQPNPPVSAGGTYTVIATAANGCTASAVAVVDLDTEAPALNSQASAVLTCTQDTIVLATTVTTATSPVQSLVWSGPNGFTSSVESPAVTVPGSYTLLATSANGCTATAVVTAIQDVVAPNAGAIGGQLSCTATSLTIDGSSSTPGVSFEWITPGGVTVPGPTPSVSEAGDYTLVVTAPNGCTATALATVTLDANVPSVQVASSNDLNCSLTTATLQATASPATVSYAWNTGASTDNISIATPGSFSVTVTNPLNGCSSVGTVAVTQDVAIPDVQATGDTLDCLSGSGDLIGTSTVSGAMFEWLPPVGSPIAGSSIAVSVAGPYTLTVTAPNGCTATAAATMAQNIDAPQVDLSGSGTLTCTTASIDLTATVTQPAGTQGVWSLPGGGTSTQATVTATAPGAYVFTATAPNGCVSNPQIVIAQDIDVPAVTGTGGQLTCAATSIALAGSSTTAGATFQWFDPQQTPLPAGATPSATVPGDYTLVVTNPANGCTASATAAVTASTAIPVLDVTAAVLTCTTPNVVLETTADIGGLNFVWTGPGITAANANVQSPGVALGGAYTVVATNPVNSCSATFSLSVQADQTPPGAAATGDTITCQSNTVTITGTSPTAGVAYTWTPPGGPAIDQQNPSVSQTGTYTLTVTGANGCTSTAQTEVLADASIPVIAVTGGTITCAVTSVQLTATSSIPGVSWQWSGPNGFSSTTASPIAAAAGSYSVTATDPQTACSSTSGVTVAANTTPPSLSTGTPDQLDCSTTEVGLSVTVASPGAYTYAWSTTTGTILAGAASPTPQVSQAGAYNVVVTNPQNGCSASAQVTVTVDPAVPSAVASTIRDVSCFGFTDGAVTLDQVEGGTAPYFYSLDNGPFTTGAVFTGLAPGAYPLTVVDANGCELQTTVTIDEPAQLVVNLGADTTIRLGQPLDLRIHDDLNIDTGAVAEVQVNPASLLPLLGCDTCGLLYNSVRYRVTVIDTNGCQAVDERVVSVDKTRRVFIANVFAPESLQNDRFFIAGGDDVRNIRVFQVYDRWGAQVFGAADLAPNAYDRGWDGSINGKQSAPAVFTYYAEIEFIDGEVIVYKGDVLLYR